LATWLALAALCSANLLHSQAPQPSEYRVKSVYLFNFGKFVQWPRNTPAVVSPTFIVCVLGEDPFGPVLDMILENETIDGKPAAAKRIARAAEASDCRIVFVSSSEARRLRGILAALDQHRVLTVSDMDRFADNGGMIQFVWDENRVRFEVNLAAAARAGLMLSSDLLKVATRVQGS
jgi:hypothetical protein